MPFKLLLYRAEELEDDEEDDEPDADADEALYDELDVDAEFEDIDVFVEVEAVEASDGITTFNVVVLPKIVFPLVVEVLTVFTVVAVVSLKIVPPVEVLVEVEAMVLTVATLSLKIVPPVELLVETEAIVLAVAELSLKVVPLVEVLVELLVELFVEVEVMVLAEVDSLLLVVFADEFKFVAEDVSVVVLLVEADFVVAFPVDCESLLLELLELPDDDVVFPDAEAVLPPELEEWPLPVSVLPLSSPLFFRFSEGVVSFKNLLTSPFNDSRTVAGLWK